MAERHTVERRRIRRVRHRHRRVAGGGPRRALLGLTAGALLVAGVAVVLWRTPLPWIATLRAALSHPGSTSVPASRKRPTPPVHRRTPRPAPSPAPTLPAGEISRAAFAALLAARQHLALTPVGPHFRDLPHAAAYDAVEAAAGAGDFGADPGPRFRPTAPVSRAFFATSVVNALGLGPEAAFLGGEPPTFPAARAAPADERGALEIAAALGLLPPSHGDMAPGAPVSLSLVAQSLAAWPTLPTPLLDPLFAPYVTSITLRVAPTQVAPGQPVSLATQVHVGELTVPLPARITVTGGTLAGGLFLPGPGTHRATISASIPGSHVRAVASVSVLAPSAVHVAPPAPTYVLPGSPVTFRLIVTDRAGQVVPFDTGRTLAATITGPTGLLASTRVTDQNGQAAVSFTPTLLGTDRLTVRAPGLTPAVQSFTVVPGALGTVSLLTPADTLRVGTHPTLKALWTPAPGATDPTPGGDVPLSLTASFLPAGGGPPETLASRTVLLAMDAAASPTSLPPLPGAPAPGTLTVSLSAPAGAVEPSTVTLPVLPLGRLRWVPPAVADVGVPVHLTVPVTGTITLAAHPTLYLTAPDGGPLDSIGGAVAGHQIEFTFVPFEAGTYHLRVAAAGETGTVGTLRVSPGRAVRVAAYLTRPFVLPGQSVVLSVFPVDRYGQPALDVPVEVRWRLVGGPSGHAPTRGAPSPGQGPVVPVDHPPGATGPLPAVAEPGARRGLDPYAWHTVRLAQGGSLPLGIWPSTAFRPGVPHAVEVEADSRGLAPVRITLPWIPLRGRASLAEGTGLFLSYWVARDESPSALVRQAQAHHVHTLFVEASVPGTGFWGQPGLDRLLPVAHAAGLSVVAWVPANLHHPALDLAVARDVLAYRTPLGEQVDGIAADFEGNLSPALLGTYLRAVRRAAGPDRVVAAIEPAPPVDAQADPLFAREADVLMPMDYWQMTESPSTYQSAYEEVATSLEFLRLTTRAAVVPILQGYDPFAPGGAGLYNPGPLAERGALRAALTDGAAGAAFFQWGSLTPQEWTEVARAVPLDPP